MLYSMLAASISEVTLQIKPPGCEEKLKLSFSLSFPLSHFLQTNIALSLLFAFEHLSAWIIFYYSIPAKLLLIFQVSLK